MARVPSRGCPAALASPRTWRTCSRVSRLASENGIRLEDDVEPRDVTDIGRVGRLDADVSGLGPPAQGFIGELGQEALSRPAERLADRLGERADLGHLVDRLRAAD